MLITPRTYSASQIPDRISVPPDSVSRLGVSSLAGWRSGYAETEAADMLLVRQTGSVRVGEVVRYTLTYTPSADNIYPSPAELHVKVKNTSAVPLRAAYLHGPYTLYTACYPSTFNPNGNPNNLETDSIPHFEPYLKAGGSWNTTIPVPEYLRENGYNVDPTIPSSGRSVTWVIEIISQIVFSSTASVHFELLVGRDEASIELLSSNGIPGLTNHPEAAQLFEHWSPETKGKRVHAARGVYSRSISLAVDDTFSLWNSPPFPSYASGSATGPGDERNPERHTANSDNSTLEGEPVNQEQNSNIRKKKVHLVVLTHGLHSNLGADMLYLKESIDIACRKARRSSSSEDSCNMQDNEYEDEQVIVRGFPGNAARTERGIQYLGKRLAKYVLLMTYPDQPYFPRKSAKTKSFSVPFASEGSTEDCKGPSLNIHTTQPDTNQFAYQITSISFIGHSLGGLVQTYAIAYIQKYSPCFFTKIQPVNFIALATPFLGLSNENPMYVRFALDLGLVGRTGQDLGLTWTAPRMRSGWEALIGGKGTSIQPQEHVDSKTKPLLRILPCGPAHDVLSRFKHRTIYSNLVNDGIVPLRTSCLLFLDWKGLERVENTRRENGLVGTMAEWTWAELTGANSKSPRTAQRATTNMAQLESTETVGAVIEGASNVVASERAFATPSEPSSRLIDNQVLHQGHGKGKRPTMVDSEESKDPFQPTSYSPLSSLFSMFRPNEPDSRNKREVFKRSQTLGKSSLEPSPQDIFDRDGSDDFQLHPPPRTTLLESASDLLVHPLPSNEFIMDPKSRPRTIFHDCVYHPQDIPAPSVKGKSSIFSRSQPGDSASPALGEETADFSKDGTGLKVEEKIARAYHRNLSWRKVLVRLEPDAHNNIIVRRMFTNAYGWPVVKHLVDAHFGNTLPANDSDVLEQAGTSPHVLGPESPSSKCTVYGYNCVTSSYQDV